MPLKDTGWKPQAPAPAQEDTGLLDKLGGWRGIGATTLRGLSGLLSGTASWEPGIGTALGAGIGGLGEAGAELIEGSNLSPSRIAAEATLGAIPGGKIFKAGKVLPTVLRSGAMGALGAGTREYAAGQPLDPTAIAESGALSAATGGLLARFLSPKVALPSGGAPVEIQPTYQTGPGTQILGEKGAQFNLRPKTITPTGEPITPGTPVSGAPARGVPITGQPPAPEDIAAITKAAKLKTMADKKQLVEQRMEQSMLDKATKFRAARMTARDKEFQEAMNARDVAETKATLQPQEPTVRETQRSAEGTKTIQWKAPSEETDSQGYKVIQRKSDYDALRQSQAEQIPPSKAAIETQVPPEARTTLSDWKDELLGPEGPVPAFKWPEAGEGTFTANAEGSHVQTPIVESTAAYAGAPAAEPQSPLAQFFKSPTDAVGSAYRAAKAEQGVNPLATRQLGISLQTEAQKAGLPTNKAPNLTKFLQDKISP
jgi:hypothetical protein